MKNKLTLLFVLLFGAFKLSAQCDTPVVTITADTTFTDMYISWPIVSNATHYEYFISTTATPPATGSSFTSNTSFHKTGLNAAKQYFFCIRTICTSGTSAWVCVATPRPACVQPDNLVSDTVTATSSLFYWDAVNGAAGYQYSLSKSPTPPSAGTPLATTFFLVNGLAEKTKYYFCVRTVCTGGLFSAWSCTDITTLSYPVGIKSVAGRSILQAYPNPVKDNVNIVLSNNDDRAVDIFITNTVGAILYRTTTHIDKLAIDMHALPAGLYFLKCTDGINAQTIKLVKE